MRHPILLFCLVLSGFTGLSYELLWVRLLTLSFGVTTLSFSTVLAVFFGGLALGSWISARWLHRVRHPVRAYALIELVMAVVGVALYPILSSLGPIFASLDPGPGLAGAFTRFIVAAPLLLIPTMLMGATLPIVSEAVVAEDAAVGRSTSFIYGFNTLGAFLGAYAVTYHLIHDLGVFRSILLTAGINVVVFGIAFVESRRVADRPPAGVPSAPDEPDEAAADEPDRKIRQVAGLITFLSGFAFICFEIVWARLFSSFLGGTIYGVGAVLICFLVGIALGSLVIARMSDRADAGRLFVYSQVIAGLGVVLVALALPRINYEIRILATSQNLDSLIPQHLQLGIVFLALIVPTAASGAAFPLLIRAVTKHARSASRRLGRLYSLNTVGSILGSLVTGFVLIPGAGSEATLYLGLLVTVVMTALGAVFLQPEDGPIRRAAPVLAALGVMASYSGLDMLTLSQNPSPQMSYPQYRKAQETTAKTTVAFVEGRVANVLVFDSSPHMKSLTLNGLGQGSILSIPPRYMIESVLVGLVPLAHLQRPKSGLVVGFGAGATVDILRRLGLPDLTVVELEEEVIEMAPVLFGEDNPLEAPNVRVEINDARHYLLVNAEKGDKRFDLITSMPAHPWVASSIFTKEFFEIAASNLAPGGIFATWFGLAGMDAEATKSLLRGFRKVFPHGLVYYVPEASAYYLVGSEAPLAIDMDELERLSKQPIFSAFKDLRDPFFLPSRVQGAWAPESEDFSQGTVNTDDTAFIEAHAPRLASSETGRVKDFLPIRTFLPRLVADASRTFYIELLERYLGTPNGEISTVTRAQRPDRAAAVLDALGESILLEPDRAYLRGRIALAKRDYSEASSQLSRAATSNLAPTPERATKFLKVVRLAQSPSADITSVLGPSATGDLLASALDQHYGPTVELARSSTSTAGGDGLGWLIRRFAHADQDVELEDLERIHIQAHEHIVGSRRRGLNRLCLEFAAQTRLEALTSICLAQLQQARRAEGQAKAKAGTQKGATGDFAEAAPLLRESWRLNPGQSKNFELLLIACTEAPRACDRRKLSAEARIAFDAELVSAFEARARRAADRRGAFEPAERTTMETENAAEGSPVPGSSPSGAGPLQ